MIAGTAALRDANSEEQGVADDNAALLHTTDKPSDSKRRNFVDLQRWQRRLQYGWALHFTITLLLLFCGIAANGGRFKYIPADPSRIPSSVSCEKAFVNVLALSVDEPDAVVCCNNDSGFSNSLCKPKSQYLPYAGRLAHFPEAWLLPLFPMALRLMCSLLARLLGRSVGEKVPATLARLFLYAVTLNFRGWVLYVGLTRVETLILPPEPAECWYRGMLRHESCRGLVFDFSDHTVLYLAQLLPLPLMETLHSLSAPFWGKYRGTAVLLTTWLAYFYYIVLRGEFKTAAYFHTGWEILAGYAISLSVQLPYAIVQCYPLWERLRLWLFGYPVIQNRND